MSLTRLVLTEDQLTFWGLHEDPFDDDAEDPANIWLSPRVRALESRMDRGIQRRDFICLSATSGMGKSTVLRRLQARLALARGARPINFGAMDRVRVSPGSMETAIIRELAGKAAGRQATSASSEGRAEMLRAALMSERVSGRTPILILDEAHNLPTEVLLYLRTLWDGLMVRPMAIVLAGQDLLGERLHKEASLREVLGRVVLLGMAPLDGAHDAAEARAYLEWRWTRVSDGSVPMPFTPAACDVLIKKTAGVPLWVNNLASGALVGAHKVGDKVVTPAHVGRA